MAAIRVVTKNFFRPGGRGWGWSSQRWIRSKVWYKLTSLRARPLHVTETFIFNHVCTCPEGSQSLSTRTLRTIDKDLKKVHIALLRMKAFNTSDEERLLFTLASIHNLYIILLFSLYGQGNIKQKIEQWTPVWRTEEKDNFLDSIFDEVGLYC